MIRTRHHHAAIVLLAMLLPGPADGQSDRRPEDGGFTYALGLPPVWKGYAGGTLGIYQPGSGDGQVAGWIHAGLYRDLLSPIKGVAALGLEAFGGVRGSGEGEGGGRALFMIPTLHVSGGVDYNIRDSEWSAIFRLEFPMRRGGIFGRGTQVRLDWIPGRSNTFGVGINAPLWGKNIGKTRPQRDSFELENPPIQRMEAPPRPPAIDDALQRVRHGSRWIAEYAMPLLDHGGADPATAYSGDLRSVLDHMAVTDARFPSGHTYNEEIRVFHEAIDRAFSVAVENRDLAQGESTRAGRELSAGARRILVDYILLPYNALLGQRKANDGLAEFEAAADAEFARWLLLHADVRPEAYERVSWVFQSLVGVMGEVRVFQLTRWEDSRFVWLPLQLGLKPEDHDTENEINDLIERGTGKRFTDGNLVSYTMNEEFQLEFARSVLEARDYHVLWIHDYRGFNAAGEPDTVGFAQTTETYLRALTGRVREYDETGRLPEYFIFLDQNYFEDNNTRLYFRVLLDPMAHRISLPGRYEAWEARLADAQAELRQAVAESRLLQAERRQFGDDWLENRIRVHVSITNPVDHSFVSNHVAGILSVPDNVIRDHRKIAFFDITEEDPYRGRAMYTGMGIGEHYVGRNWEDRAIIVSGPSALAAKDAARTLLEIQGFEPHQIPFPLRPIAKPSGYEARTDSAVRAMTGEVANWVGRALELHNVTGYGPKPINLKKAILYSLLPPGTILKVPDSLWQSYVYASLLVGTALRGGHSLIIAPALATAPSSAPPTMARAHGVLSALLAYQNALGPAIEATGGLLHVGLYLPEVGVGDLQGRIRQAMSLDVPWVRDLFPSNPAITAAVDSIGRILSSGGYQSNYLVNADSSASPKLHMKANFFVEGETWDRVLRRPEWGPVFREYLLYLAAQTGPVEERLSATEAPEALQQAALDLANGVMTDAPPAVAEKAFAYFTVGSTNMNYRSMVLDGEVEITVTGWDTLAGAVDFILLAGLTEWIDSQEQLDALLPPPGGMTRRIANLIRLLL